MTQRPNLYTIYELPDGTVHLDPLLIGDRGAMKRELAENEERNAAIRAAKEQTNGEVLPRVGTERIDHRDAN